MKKNHLIIITLMVTAVLSFTGVWLWGYEKGRDTEEIELTEIIIPQKTLSLGEVSQYSRKNALFEIKNTGHYPLIIKAVEPSCGCTAVKWNKQPIVPGETSRISITFEAIQTGKFNKSISVFCNTREEMHQLAFYGIVTGQNI